MSGIRPPAARIDVRRRPSRVTTQPVAVSDRARRRLDLIADLQRRRVLQAHRHRHRAIPPDPSAGPAPSPLSAP